MTERNCYSILKEQPEVLTVPEVSRILRLGKNKTYGLIRSGRISSIKIGGKTIVPKSCLVFFLYITKSFQFCSDSVFDSRWTSAEKCDMMGLTDRATEADIIA